MGLFSVPTYDVAKLGGVDAAVENVKVDGVGVMADWQTVWATDVSQIAKNINKNKTSFANMFDMIIDSPCRKDRKRWAVISKRRLEFGNTYPINPSAMTPSVS